MIPIFVIITYDVNKDRVTKVMKTCRKYLKHVQRSVFEGMITEGQLKKLKKELDPKINKQEDFIRIYKLDNLKFCSKEDIGKCIVEEQIM